jgi:transposase
MKTQEQQLEILFCKPKGLSFREIGRRKGCDPRTAKKYIEHPELIGQPRKAAPRPSMVDAYRDQIEAYLADDDGNHRATYIHDQLVKCGFQGSCQIVRRAVSEINGRKQHLAYVRFETMPGEQAQVDYGEFMVTLPDGSIRKYYLFAMILGYSRRLFACLTERCDLPSFLEAHLLAFEYFGGVPEAVLYDRMRNVYIRHFCETPDANSGSLGIGRPLFTQGLMTLAVHYGFTPEVAPAYAPWVKGKVERPMDFIRESWWCGYDFIDLMTANQDLSAWLTMKEERVHGTTKERVSVRFEREKPHLQHLPPQRCDVSLRLTRTVRKDCTISVDGNRYIVPHTLVGEKLTIRLKDAHLRIFSGADLVDAYDAPEGKGHLVGLDRGYYEALLADRKLQQRKYGGRQKGKGKQKGRARFKRTISPTAPRHAVVVEPIAPLGLYAPMMDVERRPMGVYDQLGGEVCYA